MHPSVRKLLIISDLLARRLGGACIRLAKSLIPLTCDIRSAAVCEKCRRSLEKVETCDIRTVPGGKRRRRSAVASPLHNPPCATQHAQGPFFQQGVQYLGRNARFPCRLAQQSAPSGHFPGKASSFWAEVPGMHMHGQPVMPGLTGYLPGSLTASYNNKATRRRTLNDGSKCSFGETFIRNEVKVLLTRGVKGLFIYACDNSLRKALKTIAGV